MVSSPIISHGTPMRPTCAPTPSGSADERTCGQSRLPAARLRNSPTGQPARADREQLRQLVEAPEGALIEAAVVAAQRCVCVAVDHACTGAVWARLWLAGPRSARFGVLSAPWLEMIGQRNEFLHHLRLYT